MSFYFGIPENDATPTIIDGDLAGDLQDNFRALNTAIAQMLAQSYHTGTVFVPYNAAPGGDMFLFANTDYDDIPFTVGESWANYLQDPDVEVWFTVMLSPRDKAPLIDAQSVIFDDIRGVIKQSFTGSQLNVKAGIYHWQLQLRKVTITQVGPPVVTSVQRRMMMEGRLEIKPTFKV